MFSSSIPVQLLEIRRAMAWTNLKMEADLKMADLKGQLAPGFKKSKFDFL